MAAEIPVTFGDWINLHPVRTRGHKWYHAEELPDGTIILTPMVKVHATILTILENLGGNETK